MRNSLLSHSRSVMRGYSPTSNSPVISLTEGRMKRPRVARASCCGRCVHQSIFEDYPALKIILRRSNLGNPPRCAVKTGAGLARLLVFEGPQRGDHRGAIDQLMRDQVLFGAHQRASVGSAIVTGRDARGLIVLRELRDQRV